MFFDSPDWSEQCRSNSIFLICQTMFVKFSYWFVVYCFPKRKCLNSLNFKAYIIFSLYVCGIFWPVVLRIENAKIIRISDLSFLFLN